MAARKAFALRIDEKTLAAMQRWAEFILRESLRRAGRLPKDRSGSED
jgi:hypothetical protein